MKNILSVVFLLLLFSCSNEADEILSDRERISNRAPYTYFLIHQDWSTSDILSQTSDDLDNWSAGAVVSTSTAALGTSSTMYLSWNSSLGDYDYRPLSIFINGGSLRWVELNDAGTGWTSPASVAGETSDLLPSVEVVDGVVLEVHAATDETGNPVQGSMKSGSSWGTSYDLFRTTFNFPGFANIASDYSPTAEYHSSAAVEYLTTADFVSGSPSFGVPRIFWRYTSTNYTETSAPGITLGASVGEFNASYTPVAVNNNGNDELFIFYTDPGTSTASDNTIRYVIGSVTGSTDGTITSWSSSNTVSSSAITTSKIDGIYTEDTEIIAITYRNSSNGKVDLAYSDDFGSNWTLVQDIAMTPGAPSLCNEE
jgi:hypothetical protein